MNLQQAIAAVIDRQNLSHDDMKSVMHLIMTGQATPAQIGGFLVGLRMKGETIDEIAAAAAVMRELAHKVDVSGDHIVDIVGTGGDGSGTFNISTASCFVVAAAGGKVAKHGNRSISSKSGSADLLEAAGVNLDLTPEQIERCIEQVGVGFMFAPRHHSAMKHAIGPRREMGVRTLFNILGPLTNPADAPNLVMGVFSAEWVEPLAHVFKALGSNHVMVVHSDDGLDEISIAANTRVAELKNGEITVREIDPADYGCKADSLESIKVENAEESLEIVSSVLANVPGPATDIVALNAGAAIYVSGLTDSMASGVARAREVIESEDAAEKMAQLIALSNEPAV